MEILSFQNYLTLQAALLVGGVIFLLWRRPERGFQLKLKAGAKRLQTAFDGSLVPVKTRPQTLNVYFNYNGHSFDAYEILGVPAGSSWTTVLEGYNRASATADPSSRSFLQAALHAIEKHVK